MNKSKFNIFIIIFSAISGFLFGNQTKGEIMDCSKNCSIYENERPFTGYGHIDTKGLANLISSKVPIIILDARSKPWDDGKRIPSAKLLSSEATEKEAAKAIPKKNSLIVVYCSNPQCPASTYLAKRLIELGYSNILKYDEGIEGWINTGHPVNETH